MVQSSWLCAVNTIPSDPLWQKKRLHIDSTIRKHNSGSDPAVSSWTCKEPVGTRGCRHQNRARWHPALGRDVCTNRQSCICVALYTQRHTHRNQVFIGWSCSATFLPKSRCRRGSRHTASAKVSAAKQWEEHSESEPRRGRFYCRWAQTHQSSTTRQTRQTWLTGCFLMKHSGTPGIQKDIYTIKHSLKWKSNTPLP